MRQTDQIEARARRRRISRRVRRAQRGFDAPTFEDDREIVIGGGDDKPAAP